MSKKVAEKIETFELYVTKKFKHLIHLESIPFIKKYDAKNFKGLMYPIYFLTKLMAPLERKALKKDAEKNNHKEFDIKADELLTKPEIRKSIKKWIIYIGSKEVVTYEKFGEIITNSLNNDDFKKKYDYPIDHVLFAFVAYKVHKIGLQKFCDDVEKEEI